MIPASSNGSQRRASSFRINFFKGRGHHGTGAEPSAHPEHLVISAPTNGRPSAGHEEGNVSSTDRGARGGDEGISEIEMDHATPFFVPRTLLPNTYGPVGPMHESHARPVYSESSISQGLEPTRQLGHSRSAVKTGGTSTYSGRSKSPGSRLRSALNLLRRRSNPNLQRSFVSPIGEQDEHEQNPVKFSEPLLDLESVEPGKRLSEHESDLRSHGFRFALPARGNPRNVLTKPPPRRSTERPHGAINSDMGSDQQWDASELFSARSSSRSSEPDVVIKAPSNDSIFSHESPALGVGGNSPGGGLFPRPASLQRHWSDAGIPQRDSVQRVQSSGWVSYVSGQGQSTERVRPVSFSGISPSTSYLFPSQRRPESGQDVRSLSGPSYPPKGMPIQPSVRAPEGLGIGDSSKRTTTSTLHHTDSYEDIGGSVSSVDENAVFLVEYNKLVALVKREQKRRKKLEAQVAALQEQVACLLHQNLVAVTSRASLPVDPENRLNHQPSNEEIPTPDITPPSTTPIMHTSALQAFDDSSSSESDEELYPPGDDADNVDSLRTRTQLEDQHTHHGHVVVAPGSTLLAPRPILNGQAISLS